MPTQREEVVGRQLDAINWRTNLSALWLAQFTAVFGFTFVIPFLPLFLRTDLGVRNNSELALWTGLVVGSVGFSQAVSNPVWGMVADRLGRKPMIVRAMVGGGATIALMGFVQSPLQLLGARIFLGVVAGSVAAANALVVAETPPREVGRALGVMGSATAIGRTIGPLIGGILAALITLRYVFIGSGVVLSLAVLVVVFLVRESPRPISRARPSFLSLRQSGPNKVRRLAVLMLGLGMCQFTYAGAQALLVLRLLHLVPATVQLWTGFAFAAGGIAAATAAATYWRLVGVIGYRSFAALTCGGLALSVVALALAPSALAIIVTIAVVSFLFGACNPTILSMIGLEAPSAMKATVLGFGQTASALGLALGPIVSGLVAAGFGLFVGLSAASVAALMGSLVLLRWAGEPPT